MTRKGFYILLLILTQAGLLHAQLVFKSVEDIWKYADAHNITILTAKYESNKAYYSTLQSYSNVLPQASLTGSFTDNTALQTTLIPAQILGGPAGDYIPVKFGQKYIYVGGINAQIDVIKLQDWFNIQIARKTEDYNKASLGNTRKTIYQQIATQYYNYLLMQEAARLAGLSELIADSVFQSISNKFKEGNVNEANVDLSKMNLERAQQTSITAQYQMQSSENNLKALLGLSLHDSLVFEASIENSLSASADAPMQEDPSIKMAYSQAQVSRGQYRLANSNFLPTVSLSYYNSTQQYDNKYEPFEGGPAWFPATYWSLKASWTIFNGGYNWLNSKKSKIALDENHLKYEDAIKQSAINDENLRLSYIKAKAILQKTGDVMKLSFDNYSHISYRYEAGIQSLEDRLNAFSDYINYQNQYLNSLSDMLVQLYQLKIRQQSF